MISEKYSITIQFSFEESLITSSSSLAFQIILTKHPHLSWSTSINVLFLKLNANEKYKNVRLLVILKILHLIFHEILLGTTPF